MNTQDERVMGALAHIAALLPVMGIIASIVIWVTQKDKSRFVAFQALQAIAYQLTFIVVWLIGMACYMGTFFLTFAGGIMGSVNPDTSLLTGGLFFLPFLVFFGLFALMGIWIIYAIIAAVMVFQGKDFRYFLIGRWVERYSQQMNGTPL